MKTYLVKITLITGGSIEWYLHSISKFNVVIRAFNKLNTNNQEEVVKIMINEVIYPVEDSMSNMVKIKFYCSDCHMEFEVKYDDDEFIRPSHCVGCGSDNDLKELED